MSVRLTVPRAALVGLVGATLLLAACDGDEEDPTSTPTASVTATTTATAAPTTAATETPTADATGTADATETPAEGDATVQFVEEGDLAPYLAGPDGMTLYVFANDEPGVSNCDAGCLANWPPLTVEAGEEPVAGEGVTGTLATIEHEDGTLQVTYNDQPLYYYVGDTAAGDTTGHELNGVWFVATPDSGS